MRFLRLEFYLTASDLALWFMDFAEGMHRRFVRLADDAEAGW